MPRHGIVVRALLTAMRTTARSLEIAELAVRYRDLGVVGFDIAGAEAGWPPSRHLDAFEYVQRENFHITIHAGEAFGLPSIWEAVQFCGAERLGHGVRIVDDIKVDPDGSASLGRLASFVRDRRIALELCPTSNVQTGAAPSIAEHPIGLLRDLNFRVTVNTDNRLMSGITLSSELHALADAFGYGWADLQWLTINAMKSAFLHFDDRLDIINTVHQARLRRPGLIRPLVYTPPGLISAGSDQVELAGPADRSAAVIRRQLAVDVPEVGLDGIDGDVHFAGDLGRGQQAGQVQQHLPLAFGERLHHQNWGLI